MPTAKQLVQEKKYSEAAKILAEIIKNEPQRLDEVESLMAVIRSVRNQYNSNYANLLALLKKENLTDQDIANAYRLINDMRDLDASPDKAIIASFEQARRTIVFRYNDMQFQDIMNRALALIQEKKYWEAIALYEDAAGLHRELLEEDYPEDILREADAMVLAAKDLINTILSYQNSYSLAAQRAARESSRDIQAPLNSREYNDLINIIDIMAAAREEISLTAARFDNRKMNFSAQENMIFLFSQQLTEL